MSDIAKWIILAVGVAAMIAVIMFLPFGSFLNVVGLSDSVNIIVRYAGSAFEDVRALINLLLHPWARTALSGLMAYLFAKWVFKIGVKITAWAFHWIFK